MGRFALALTLAAPLAASRAEACFPACSGYHLNFSSPLGAGTTADRSATITWQDTVDGPSATFDLLVSDAPVPAYSMHSFPSELPGEIIALGLSATAQQSFTWDTSSRPPGTYFLYAVFHNPPFDTLVMPFAAVAVAHGTSPVAPAALIRSPRGVNAVAGQVTVELDAVAGPGAVATVYVGTPPTADDGIAIGTLSGGAGQSLAWDASSAAAGTYVFKLVVTDASGHTATAYSPGQVQVGAPASASCSTGGGVPAFFAFAGLLALRRRR